MRLGPLNRCRKYVLRVLAVVWIYRPYMRRVTISHRPPIPPFRAPIARPTVRPPRPPFPDGPVITRKKSGRRAYDCSWIVTCATYVRMITRRVKNARTPS